MKANDLLDMIGNTDDGIIEEAKKRKRPAVARWTKWVAVAACVCLAIGIAVSHNSPSVVTDNNYADTAQGHFLETAQKMTVKIVGWSDGSIVHVEFTAYEDYDEGNHYYNRATGSHLELVE